jgi:hypothetical protein
LSSVFGRSGGIHSLQPIDSVTEKYILIACDGTEKIDYLFDLFGFIWDKTRT